MLPSPLFGRCIIFTVAYHHTHACAIFCTVFSYFLQNSPPSLIRQHKFSHFCVSSFAVCCFYPVLGKQYNNTNRQPGGLFSLIRPPHIRRGPTTKPGVQCCVRLLCISLSLSSCPLHYVAFVNICFSLHCIIVNFTG